MSLLAYLNPNLTTEDLIRMEQAKHQTRLEVIKQGEKSLDKVVRLLDSLGTPPLARVDAIMQVYNNTMRTLSMLA